MLWNEETEKLFWKLTMKRFINQLNVSITTNRTCTLACTHCYIAPHLFKDKTQMTEEVYRSVFDRIESLKAVDGNLEEIEWEVIGGETTMMPFEWWEKQLPWTLDRITKINEGLRDPGSLNYLTNLIYTDKRYTDLFNKYGHHPYFCLYTSWEPDTERFGKRNQLFNRFYETLKSIDAREKILDIILTKATIEIGAERILDMFLPAGVTDFSIKMISPYGSGKAFFEPNQPTFEQMTQFFMDMDRLKPKHITFTPQEEMLSSVMKSTSFQCNGNFKYDLSIEPDGVCHFNANQTADEAAIGFRSIKIDDPEWARKICFENKTEENNKLSLKHPECDQCEYLTHCNAGWYHYKVHDSKVIDKYRENECSGFRKFWDHTKASLKDQASDRGAYNHLQAVRARLPGEAIDFSQSKTESSLSGRYDDYFTNVQGIKSILIDKKNSFGKKAIERLWFYNDLGIQVQLADNVLFESKDIESIIEHVVFDSMVNVHITDYQLLRFLDGDSILARRIRYFCGLWLAFSAEVIQTQEANADLIIDARNEEMFRYMISFIERTGYRVPGVSLSNKDRDYLNTLSEYISLERMVRSGR